MRILCVSGQSLIHERKTSQKYVFCVYLHSPQCVHLLHSTCFVYLYSHQCAFFAHTTCVVCFCIANHVHESTCCVNLRSLQCVKTRFARVCGVVMEISIPIGGLNGGIDDILTRGLSEAVSRNLFSGGPSFYSTVKIPSVDHPVPTKWASEVALADDGVFVRGPPPANLPIGPPSVGWNGNRAFEHSLGRLGLDRAILQSLDSDEAIYVHFSKNVENLQRAKKNIKNELKEYDSQFKAETGKEASRTDKEPMRLLYTLYRKLRDLAGTSDSATSSIVMPSARLESLYEEKQQVRAVLQEYQARFMNEQGRRIKYHRDIVAVDREYRQYKQLKEEIAKLETQLGRAPKNSNDAGFFN